ncbi:MAG: PIN domain-containing protein [Acidimicrobiales bacterium]
MILLDSSALLALLYDEAGADTVQATLDEDECALSLVNLAEVLERGERSGGDAAVTLATVELLVRFEPLTAPDALEAARLWPVTRRPALSLADRLALATARRLGADALTADQAWSAYAAAARVRVRLVRQ